MGDQKGAYVVGAGWRKNMESLLSMIGSLFTAPEIKTTIKKNINPCYLEISKLILEESAEGDENNWFLDRGIEEQKAFH